MKRARSAVASMEAKQTATFVEYISNVRTFRLNGWDVFIQRKLDQMTDEMRPLRSRAIFLKMMNLLTSFTLSPTLCVILAISSSTSFGRLTPSLARSIFDLFDLNKCDRTLSNHCAAHSSATTAPLTACRYPMLALPGAARACSNASASYDLHALPVLNFCNN
jgi:hypothetical protein